MEAGNCEGCLPPLFLAWSLVLGLRSLIFMGEYLILLAVQVVVLELRPKAEVQSPNFVK